MNRFQKHLNKLICIALSSFWLAVLSMPAQAADSAPLRQQRDESYQRLLENPADRPETLLYAAINMRMGDYESAIPPLERILMHEPANAKIRMQIGVLYKSLGSKLLAREYLSKARDTKDAEAKIVERAKEYLRGL